MSRCIIGRPVTIALRNRKNGCVHEFTVVCPVQWRRSRFLSYVRREHPESTVRIVEWGQSFWPSDNRTLWLVAPDEMMASAS